MATQAEYLSSLKSMRLTHIYEGLRETDVSTAHMVASAAILRAYRIVSLRVEAALAPLDLTMARFEVLGLLATSAEGRMGFSELKKITLLHPATMTHTMDYLERRKLLRRRRDDGDRRAVVAEITAAGRSLADRARALLDQMQFGLEELDEATARQVSIELSELRRT